eukprot:scaffold4504_cov58-Cyclotella_meneghiniana.AAC.2
MEGIHRMTTNGLGKLKILYIMSLALVWLAIYTSSQRKLLSRLQSMTLTQLNMQRLINKR